MCCASACIICKCKCVWIWNKRITFWHILHFNELALVIKGSRQYRITINICVKFVQINIEVDFFLFFVHFFSFSNYVFHLCLRNRIETLKLKQITIIQRDWWLNCPVAIGIKFIVIWCIGVVLYCNSKVLRVKKCEQVLKRKNRKLIAAVRGFAVIKKSKFICKRVFLFLFQSFFDGKL